MRTRNKRRGEKVRCRGANGMHTTRPVYTITNKKHEPCAAVTPLSSSSLRQCGTSCTCKAHSAAAAREQGKHVLRVRPIPPLVLAGDTGRPLRRRAGPERPPCRRPAAPRKTQGHTHGRAETHGMGSQKRTVAPAPLCVSYRALEKRTVTVRFVPCVL